jgi:hypothetical protein
MVLVGTAGLLLIAAYILIREAFDTGATRSARVAATGVPQGLVVRTGSAPAEFITLAGEPLRVPERLRASPRGLSPDGRLVAAVDEEAVLMGSVRGGPMRVVLRGECYSCPYGADPSHAWSPDSRRLAAALTPEEGATLLKLVDRNGRVTRSFTLPGKEPVYGERLFYNVISWSPDGGRLLLRGSDNYGPRSLETLDVRTGKRRTGMDLHPCSSESVSWSPDGRFLVLTDFGSVSLGVNECGRRLTVVDALFGRTLIHYETACMPDCDTTWTPAEAVWADDSRTLFGSFIRPASAGRVSTTIERFSLAGRRTVIVGPSVGPAIDRDVVGPTVGTLTPRLALRSGLIYQADSPRRSSLYLQDFGTGQRVLLVSFPARITSVAALPRLP